MEVGMSNDEFVAGLKNINAAIYQQLDVLKLVERSVQNMAQGSGPRETTFIVTVKGKQHRIKFSIEEIQDSNRSIDPMAMAKVRAFVNAIASDS
jgi:hypothetical protein